MNWIINLVSKMVGATGWLKEYMPLLGGLSAALIGAGHVAAAFAQSTDPASALAVAKSVAGSPDAAAIAAGVGMIVQHFKHQDLAANAQATAQVPPAAQ